jgi:hypothetical protein
MRSPTLWLFVVAVTAVAVGASGRRVLVMDQTGMRGWWSLSDSPPLYTLQRIEPCIARKDADNVVPQRRRLLAADLAPSEWDDGDVFGTIRNNGTNDEAVQHTRLEVERLVHGLERYLRALLDVEDSVQRQFRGWLLMCAPSRHHLGVAPRPLTYGQRRLLSMESYSVLDANVSLH